MNRSKRTLIVAVNFAVLIGAVVGSYILLRPGFSGGNPVVRELPLKEQQALKKTLNKVKSDAFPVTLPTRLPYRAKNGRAMVTYVPQHPNTAVEVDVYFGNSPHELSIEESKGPALKPTTQEVSLKSGAHAYFYKSRANSSLVWVYNGIRIAILSHKINNKTNPPTSIPDLNKNELIQIANSFK